jgi:ADP-L-glycero-D-manno-heptose 6-epimerase
MIVITGGAGFIGSAMLWELNRLGYGKILIVDDLGQAASGKWLNLRGLKFHDFIHKNDFLDLLLQNRLLDISTVIHMGAISSTTEPDAGLLLKNNFEYSKVIAGHCLAHDIRLLYASSAATYGDGSAGYSDDEHTLDGLRPLNMYGFSKHLFDLWALQNGILEKAAGLKFFNVYGPNEYHKEDMRSVVCKAYGQIRECGCVHLFRSHREGYLDGEQLRDFVYVKDCTKIMAWLMQNPSASGLFNIGSGKARTFKDLVNATFAAMGREPCIDYVPMPENIREKYQYYTCAEDGKLRAAGYTEHMTTLENGVRDYVQQYLDKPSPFLESTVTPRVTL